VAAGLLGQPPPLLRVEAVLPATETRRDHSVRVHGQRQRWGRRQIVETVQPVPLVGGHSLLSGGGQNVVAEAHPDRAQLGCQVTVERRQLVEEDHDAERIEHDVVETEAETDSPVAVPHPTDFQQRPTTRIGNPVGQLRPQATQRLVATVADVDTEPADLRQYPLVAVLVEDRAEHVVPPHKEVDGSLQPVEVDICAVELPVPVRADPAEGKVAAASQPVRPLYVGRWERLMSVRRVRAHRRRSGAVGLTSTKGGREVAQRRCGEQLP